jgi:uncharacterized protein YukE
MSTIIHMETEKVNQAASQLVQTGERMDARVNSLSRTVQAMGWEGPTREQYMAEFSILVQRLVGLSEESRVLGSRVQRELEEWLTADQQNAQEYASIGTAITGWWQGVKDTWNGLTHWVNIELAKREFQKWWDGLDDDRRLAFLKQQHEKIARQYGFDPIEVRVEDIPDPKGKDSKGYNSGTVIVIDSDNLKSDNPWELVNIIAHESRHQYQSHVVQEYQRTGKLPDGVSQQQVDDWNNNQKNYIHPEDDFEGYWNQANEKDARDFGGSYSEQLLENKGWQESSSGGGGGW